MDVKYETPNFTLNTDEEGYETANVDRWPKDIQVSNRFAVYPHWETTGPFGLTVSQDTLSMWCSNGRATYRIVSRDRLNSRWRCTFMYGYTDAK